MIRRPPRSTLLVNRRQRQMCIRDRVKKVVDDNPQSVEDFKNGKDRAIGFLVGQIMKQTRGKANPKMVNKLLNQELQSR